MILRIKLNVSSAPLMRIESNLIQRRKTGFIDRNKIQSVKSGISASISRRFFQFWKSNIKFFFLQCGSGRTNVSSRRQEKITPRKIPLVKRRKNQQKKMKKKTKTRRREPHVAIQTRLALHQAINNYNLHFVQKHPEEGEEEFQWPVIKISKEDQIICKIKTETLDQRLFSNEIPAPM